MSTAPDPQLAKNVNRGVAWSGASQAVIAIGDMISQIAVAAIWLSSKDLGIAMAAMAFYPVLDTAADLGVASALIQRDDHTPEKVSTVFWFNVLVSVALCLMLLGFGPLVGAIQGEPLIGTLISIYGVKLLLQNFYAIPFALLRKQLRFAEVSKLRAIAYLGESIARVVFAALGYTVWCLLLAALTRAVIFTLLMVTLHPFRPRWVFRPREVTDYIRFSMRSSGSAILYQLYTNLDYAVVTYFFGPVANGIYTLAYSVVLEPVRTITNVVSDVAFPTFARLRHTPARLVDQFVKFTRLNLIAVLPFVLLIALIIPDFFTTFYLGGRWTADQLEMSSNVARILCLVGVLRALGFLGPPLLDGIGRPDLTLRYMIVTAILMPLGFVVGALVLGDRLGPYSVAIAWAAFYPLAFVVLAKLVMTAISLPGRTYLKQTRGIIAIAVLSLAVGMATLFLLGSVPPWMRMLATMLTSMATMFALLARFENVTPRALKAALAEPPKPQQVPASSESGDSPDTPPAAHGG